MFSRFLDAQFSNFGHVQTVRGILITQAKSGLQAEHFSVKVQSLPITSSLRKCKVSNKYITPERGEIPTGSDGICTWPCASVMQGSFLVGFGWWEVSERDANHGRKTEHRPLV